MSADDWQTDYDGTLVRRSMTRPARARVFEKGELVPGKGVFVGAWTPKDRDGRSLGKTFNVFAAPYDLGLDEQGRGQKLVVTYNDAVKAVGELTNLMRHSGAAYNNDAELYGALRDGTYKGEWFIPTLEILRGTSGGVLVQRANLYESRDTGVFKDTFRTEIGDVVDSRHWSCAERRDRPSCVWTVDFTDGYVEWDLKENGSVSSRVVRAEPVNGFVPARSLSQSPSGSPSRR